MIYKELQKQHQEKINNFPKIVAFTEESFKKGMKKLSVNNEADLIQIASFVFIRKIDLETYKELNLKFKNQVLNLINEKKGYKFCKTLFSYMLNNYEYAYTYDLQETYKELFNKFGISKIDIQENKNLRLGLKLALYPYHR